MQRTVLAVGVLVVFGGTFMGLYRPTDGQTPPPRAPAEAVQEAQTPRVVPETRPEQRKTEHDRSAVFSAGTPAPSSSALPTQPDEGRVTGFDFSRDPFGAKKPMQTFEETMKVDVDAKPNVMAAQRKLLEGRYDLTPRQDPSAKMSRGKPVAIGPTARLRNGMTWDQPGHAEARRRSAADSSFPIPRCLTPSMRRGPGLSARCSSQCFRASSDLTSTSICRRPSCRNFRPRSSCRTVRSSATCPAAKSSPSTTSAGSSRISLPPFSSMACACWSRRCPRKNSIPRTTARARNRAWASTCLDCHVNGHTTGQFHLNPDNRPQERRFRLDTTSLRGMFNQQIHGSKRSLRSVEDFTEFEQRTAYFNGDQIHAIKKGMMILDRVQVSHMAQMQNMFDFPPAPETEHPRPPRSAAARPRAELRGEALFFGKAQCATCHPAPAYLDHQMHDLKLERFVRRAAARSDQDIHASRH